MAERQQGDPSRPDASGRVAGEALATIEARLDQLVAVVQGRLLERLDQLAAGLAQVQDQLRGLENQIGRFRDELSQADIWPDEEDEATDEAEEPADSTVEPEAP